MTVVILVLVLAFMHLDSAAATVLFDPGALDTVAGAIIVVVERNFSTVGGSEAEAAAIVDEFVLELEGEAAAIVDCALELEAEAAAAVDDLEAEAGTIVEFALELELETEAAAIVDCALELELEAEAAATDCALELEAEAAATVDSVLELAAAAACSEITDLGTTLL